jgi:hypothetical protein
LKNTAYFSAVFQHKTTERSQKIKPLCQQKSRDPHTAPLHACNKAEAAFEKCGFVPARSFNTKQPRGHKNKAALSTKKPWSVPGFIVRVQKSRNGFRRMRFVSARPFNTKQPSVNKKAAILSGFNSGYNNGERLCQWRAALTMASGFNLNLTSTMVSGFKRGERL